MKFGIVVFPGTWSEYDCYYAIQDTLSEEAQFVWHKETSLDGFDCVILPGGFSYGDYLRPGAIARFSPIMPAIIKFARQGGLVMGICNGFQVLCEAGLLPGALIPNRHLQFRCEWVHLRVENIKTPFTQLMAPGQILHIPISHGDGNYFAENGVLDTLENKQRVIFRYCSSDGELLDNVNPNGSAHHIAGVTNDEGNVLGMMPHPERAVEYGLGGKDGLLIFQSILRETAAITN